MRVFIWGTGKCAQEYLEANEVDLDSIVGFIQTKISDKKEFHGKCIYKPSDVVKCDYDYILVCTYSGGNTIHYTATDVGLDVNKMYFIDNCDCVSIGTDLYAEGIRPYVTINDNEQIKSIFPIFYEKAYTISLRQRRGIISLTNGSDQVYKSLLYTDRYHDKHYFEDYYRYRTFEMIADELIKKQIAGCVAEVGVFRGHFARLINEKFKDRTMYLFDTFESFDKDELGAELAKGRISNELAEGFKHTSVSYVISQMKYSDKCIVRKGFFPKTSEGLENERFVFVSLDVDLEDSIYEGLKWFYPRLSKGGVIFLHDYNNYPFQGVRVAVERYEKSCGELIKIPIADEGGTCMIYKI